MALKITKPEINIREKLNELEMQSGAAGRSIVRADTTEELQSMIGVGGRKNAIINGGFDVWQRGTSISMPQGTAYGADRWVGYSGSTGRVYSLDTTEALSIGFKNCAKLINGTAGPSFYQRIEDVRTFAGQTVTLSFWLKTDLAHTPNWQKIEQNFGSGGSSAVATMVGDLGEVTTEWKRFTVTVKLPSVEGKTIGPDSYVLVYPLLLTASRTYWTTGWQLELGKVATPFEHRSYGEELALCQRYYEVFSSNDNNRPVASAWDSNYANIQSIQYKVTKRASPTITVVTPGQVYLAGGAGWTDTNSMDVTPTGTVGDTEGVSMRIYEPSGFTARDAVFTRNWTITITAEL